MDFFKELFESSEFCESLGRLVLISGKIESCLRVKLQQQNVQGKLEKLTLGALITRIKKEQALCPATIELLEYIKTRRNYLTHNLFPLFSEEIEATLLPNDSLEPEDVEFTFTPKVQDLISDMVGALEIISEDGT